MLPPPLVCQPWGPATRLVVNRWPAGPFGSIVLRLACVFRTFAARGLVVLSLVFLFTRSGLSLVLIGFGLIGIPRIRTSKLGIASWGRRCSTLLTLCMRRLAGLARMGRLSRFAGMRRCTGLARISRCRPFNCRVPRIRASDFRVPRIRVSEF